MVSRAVVLYPQLEETNASTQIERSKKVQLGLTNPASSQAVSYSSQSTISRAPAVEEVVSTRPKLFPHAFHPSMTQRPSLVLMMIRAQDLGSLSIHALSEMARENFENACNQYREVSQEAIDAWIKSLEMNENAGTWSCIQRVISYGTSAAAIIGGGVAIASGGSSAVFGYVLLVSGGINLGNEAMTLTGAWNAIASYFSSNQETVSRIATGLQVGTMIMGTGAGIFAGYCSLPALQSSNYVELAAQTVNAAASVAGGGASIAKGISDSRAREADKRFWQTQEQSKNHNADVTEYTRDFEQMAKKENQTYSSTSDMVERERELISNH